MKLTALSTPVQTPEDEKPKITEVISVEPTTIQRLLDRANQIAADSVDFSIANVGIHNLRFNDQAGLTFIPDGGDIQHAGISRYALGQLGTKIGVPAAYLEKCVASGRISLAQDNVNSWVETYGKDLFLREYQGDIRGVLTSRYAVCDSHEILEVVDNVVDLSTYKIKGSFLNQERLHVRLVSKEMLPIEGEDLFAGLFIDSSDVGRSILTVQFGIYKQVCTNGLVIAKAGGVLFQQKHIGITSSEFRDGLTKSLANVDVLTENAVQWIELARQKDVWGYKPGHLSEEEMTEFVARVQATTRLPETSAKKVIDLMQTKYGASRWGLINGITEVAQDFTLERRLDLERVAGNLLAA